VCVCVCVYVRVMCVETVTVSARDETHVHTYIRTHAYMHAYETPNFTMATEHGNIKSYLHKYKHFRQPNVLLQKRRTNSRPHII